MEKIDLFEVYRQTMVNGGYTIKPSGRYLVGLKRYGKTVSVRDFNTDDLADYLANTLPDMKDVTMGTWKHKDLVHLDTSIAFKTLESALKRAKRERQLAIYDIQEGKEIFL